MYLCIDTTTSESGVTLVDGKSAIHVLLDLHNASEKLLETVDMTIKKSKKGLVDIKGVFVIKGPGSFTGLRIGIAVANQFAHQLKVPITGLTTDEWWSHRTDEKKFVYLQTMNKSEVYTSQIPNSKHQTCLPACLPVGRVGKVPNKSKTRPEGVPLGKPKLENISQIIPIEDLSGKKLWLGELSDEHQKKIPAGFKEVADILSTEETWRKVVQSAKDYPQKTYDLVEPYYGKEPTITKSRKKLSI